MPFKSKSQMRACFAKNDPNWDCKEWAKETKSTKKLPDRIKKAMFSSFSKISKDLFDPRKSPPVPGRVLIQQSINQAKEEKMKGMTPVEYRNELTSRNKGIVQKNKKSNKSS